MNYSDPFGLCPKEDKICKSLDAAAQWAARILGSNKGVRGTIPGDSRQMDLTRFGVGVRGRVLTNTQVGLESRAGGASTIHLRGNVEIDDVPKAGYFIVKEGSLDLPEGSFTASGYTWFGSVSGKGNLRTGDYEVTGSVGPLSISHQGNFRQQSAPQSTPTSNFTGLCQQTGACH